MKLDSKEKCILVSMDIIFDPLTDNKTDADPMPKMFQDISEKDMRILSDDEELRDGGAALTVYARMQFEEMSDYEREEIQKALLKYCELDTMAMVMIYEGWKDLLRWE